MFTVLFWIPFFTFYKTSLGIEMKISKGVTDIFFGKMDPSGTFLWLKTYGGKYDDYAGDIKRTNNGDIYLSGSYSDSVEFIPGQIEFTQSYEMFMLKLDSADNEKWLFSTSNPTTFPFFEVSSNCYDGDNGIYIGGRVFDYYSDSVNFQSSGNTDYFYNNNIFNGFVTKLDTAGNYQWTKLYASTNDDHVDYLTFNKITSQLLISGRAGNDTIDFDSTILSDTLSFSNGLFGNYLLSVSKNGDYNWLKLLFADSGGPEELKAHIETDNKGNIHALSTFASTIDVNPGYNDTLLYSPSPGGVSYSSYSVILDSLGDYIQSYQYKTRSNADISYGFGKDPYDNFYIGLFNGVNTSTDTLIIGNDSLISDKFTRDIIKYNLCYPSSDSIAVSSCYSYTSLSGKYVWNSSGIYKDTVMNFIGCDSIITINLNIDTADVSISTNGNTISSNANFSNYQWLDCNNSFLPIAGATSQSYTATANGNYAVEVTQNGCIDTSSCVSITTVGLLENTFEKKITLYPNPTNGHLNINLDSMHSNVMVDVKNILGQEVLKENFESIESFDLKIEDLNGIYIVEIASGDEHITIKVIKE